MLLLSVAIAMWLCAVVSLSDHSPDDVLTFLLLGDWGKGGTSGSYGQRRALDDAARIAPASSIGLQDMELLKEKKVLRQMQVANAMGGYAAHANPRPSFLIALGDNFYDNGVYSTTDVLWKYLWKDVYLGFDALNIPWFPVFGNHDYGYGATGVKAQIQRTYEHTDDDIWEFPSTNYTRRFDIPGKGGGSVVVVFIDTTTLAPSINRCCNSNGGVSETVQKQRIANQLTHIERMLNDTLSDPPNWLLVAGHYPIYSASSNGDVAELQTYLLPLLAKYKVHAYICGHDHIGEHLQKTGYETEFFVVGAGTMVDTVNAASSAGELVWAGPSYASFASINATLVDLTIAFRDTNGTLRYNYTLKNPNPNFVPVGGGAIEPPGDDPDPGNGTGGVSSEGDNRQSMLSWSYWVDTAAGASQFDVAVASGGVAALGMMLFICFLFYKRRSSQVKEKATAEFLLQARTREMVHSPLRGGAKKLSAFYGRKKYSELMEMGDLEEGADHAQHGGEGHRRQDTDYFSDEDDDYINMAPAAAVNCSPSTSTETLNSNENIPSRNRAATAHSRSSSAGSFASSTHHGRYSHSLSEEQTAAASAWLETHPRKTSWAGVSPPPPSPGGEHHSVQERVLSTGPLYNPLHISQKLSPPKGAASSPIPPGSIGSSTASTPSTPSPPKASPRQMEVLPRPPKKVHHQTSTSGRMSSDEGIGMEPMSSSGTSSHVPLVPLVLNQPTESPTAPPAIAGGRMHFPPRSGTSCPPHHHRRINTSPV